MAEQRVQFQNIVENQLPTYVQTEFPLVSDFLKSYYVSQEFQGAPVDLIQNIDDYTKLAISDVIKMVENNDDKEKLVNVLKDKFQITETPTYDTNKSLWHTMMKEYNI